MCYACYQLCLSSFLLTNCSDVHNISIYSQYFLPWLSSFDTQILISIFIFSFFSFSISPSFCLSLLLFIFPMPTATKSLTFWWSLWVNKDEILIESVVCVLVYSFFHLFFTFCRIFSISSFSISSEWITIFSTKKNCEFTKDTSSLPIPMKTGVFFYSDAQMKKIIPKCTMKSFQLSHYIYIYIYIHCSVDKTLKTPILFSANE